MTDAELIDRLVSLLVRRAGKGRPHWRRVLGPVRLYPVSTHPSCNWSIEPTGAPADVETAQQALDGVRLDHPILSAARD